MEQQIKFIPEDAINTAKNVIPIENVLVKLFEDMEYKKDRSTAKIKVFKNNGYIGFVFTNSNTLTLKDNTTGQTVVSGDNINLVQKVLGKNFKDAVIWLLEKFDLIKEVQNGEIILNDKQIQEIQQQHEEEKIKNLHELEIKEQIARQQIQYFKQIGTLQVDKDIRGINKDLINLITKDNNAFKIVKNADKGSRLEFKIALRDFNGNIDGLQTIYFNIFNKKWEKRNVGRANVSFFGNKNAKNVVITESFFDSLSAIEVMAKLGNVNYKEILDNYLVISINGQYSRLKEQTIKQMLQSKEQIILSHDNDGTGQSYDKMFLLNGVFEEDVKGKEVYILKPKSYKDLNDFVRNSEFKEDDIKKHLILGGVDTIYLDYINNKRLEKQLKELEKEELTNSGGEEQQQEQQPFSPKKVSSLSNPVTEEPQTFNLSEILANLKQTKTVKDTTNLFYKIEDNAIKFTRFTAKQSGIKSTGVFFKQDSFIEMTADGKEKGTGVVILQGKSINKTEDTENVIFANSVISAFKIATSKNLDISKSFIFVVKNQSLENKILFDNFAYTVFGNTGDINTYAAISKNKSGKFLAELLGQNSNTKYLGINVVMEDMLKGVSMINDVVTVSGKEKGKSKSKQLALEF